MQASPARPPNRDTPRLGPSWRSLHRGAPGRKHLPERSEPHSGLPLLPVRYCHLESQFPHLQNGNNTSVKWGLEAFSKRKLLVQAQPSEYLSILSTREAQDGRAF